MRLELVFKALSDGTRREILKLLRQRDMTAGEIGEHFAISKPSISHHLGILKQANLVLDERCGQNIIYSLNTTVFQDVIAWLLDILGKDNGQRNEGVSHDGSLSPPGMKT